MTTFCSYEAGGEDNSNSSFHRSETRTREFNRISSGYCIYCESKLSRRKLDEHLPPVRRVKPTPESFRNGYVQHDFASLELKNCEYCGWWLMDYGLSYTGIYGATGVPIHRTKLLFGEVKHYDVSCLDGPLGALKAYLARNPNHLAHLHPTKFELLMQDCLSEYFGAAEVIHTGRTGDGGVDLKMILTDLETYLVQVKRRRDLSRLESVQVVRELNGVLFREGRAKGMVVTTARGFTAAAKRETEIRTVTNETYEMRLLAFDDIVKMLRINRPSPYEPWVIYLNDIDFSPSDRFLKSSYFGREKCQRCYGGGRIKTGGGCSMEHGISTSCDEYGCLPVTTEVCPLCNGDGDLPSVK